MLHSMAKRKKKIMSDRRPIQESPSQIISRFYLKIRAMGKGQAAAYCFDVAQLYNTLHAEPARTLPFDLTSGTPAQIMDRCFKRVDRWLDPVEPRQLPLDAIRALIDAMPAELRRPCWGEVLGAIGFLCARTPAAEDSAHAAFGELVDVFGKISQAAAPIMADGKIDSADRPYAPAMLKKIDQMRGQLAAWEHALRTQALGE